MKYNTSAPSRPAETTPRFDPATWTGQARHLARNDADAAALLALGVCVLVSALLLWIAWPIRDLLAAAASALLLLAIQGALIGLTWIVVYARTLRRDTRHVRATTWSREIETGQDLDGDGVVGPPSPASRTVRVTRGDQVDEIILDMPARSSAGGPVLLDFGVTAPDLVSFLFEADLRRGLQERNWVGDTVQAYVLPSGQRVTQSLFRQIVAGLAARGMAIKSAGRWELDCDPETVAEQLK